MVLAGELYDMGMLKLNGSLRPDKSKAYELLVQAADLGNQDAKVMVAWAQLLGSYLPLDTEKARQTFEELSDLGIPDGHLVISVSTCLK